MTKNKHTDKWKYWFEDYVFIGSPTVVENCIFRDNRTFFWSNGNHSYFIHISGSAHVIFKSSTFSGALVGPKVFMKIENGDLEAIDSTYVLSPSITCCCGVFSDGLEGFKGVGGLRGVMGIFLMVSGPVYWDLVEATILAHRRGVRDGQNRLGGH